MGLSPGAAGTGIPKITSGPPAVPQIVLMKAGAPPGPRAAGERQGQGQGQGGARGRGPFAGAVAPALLGQSRVGLAEHGASLLFRLLPFSSPF